MLKFIIIALILSASSQRVVADSPPSAGGQILQLAPAPIILKAAPTIRIEQVVALAVPVADESKIQVNSLQITGQTLYSKAELLAITGFTPGHELTLTELRALAQKITDYYRRNGFFVAHAYLPQQDIKGGAVTIAVIEGEYGKVILHNHTYLTTATADGVLNGLHSGDVIATPPLERRLLLLSDLPGVEVKSTLVPGATLGASDLIVDLAPGPRITGEVDVDNAGNRYTGMYRLGATVNVNELLGYGDVASVRAVTSGYGLFYVRASYQVQVSAARVGVAGSMLSYRLGEEFESLHANGTAQVASIYGSYPLIRSRNNNLNAGVAVNYRTFEDRVDSSATVTDKQAQLFMASLYGDHHDTLLGGGLSSYSLTVTTGNLDIRSQAARTTDAATAQSSGLYNKLGFSLTRLQSLTESFSVFASLNGQVAFNNLDVSEKMELGGMYAVRAYPEGEAYADEGYVLTVEARMLLPKLIDRLPGEVQLVGFVDTGTVTVNKTPWTTEQNDRTLSGAGIGVNWMDYNNFSVKAYCAFKLGNESATSAPDKSGRFWVQLVKYF